MKGILSQLWCLIIDSKYPSAWCWGHWEWYWDETGNVKYDHFQTLVNVIKSKL